MACIDLMVLKILVAVEVLETNFADADLGVSSRLGVAIELVERVKTLFTGDACEVLLWLQLLRALLQIILEELAASTFLPALRPPLNLGRTNRLLEIASFLLLSLLSCVQVGMV